MSNYKKSLNINIMSSSWTHNFAKAADMSAAFVFLLCQLIVALVKIAINNIVIFLMC